MSEITIKLAKSRIGCTPNQKKTLDALGLRRRETESHGGRTSAYAHRRAAVCAGGAGKRCAPERDFSAAEAGRRLCLRTEIYCKNGKSAAKTRWYFSGILFLPRMRSFVLHGRAGVGQYAAR